MDIIYLPREYEWAQSQLKTFNNTSGVAAGVLEVDVGDFSVGLVYAKCNLLGLCDGIIDKPLLCQMYPFLPRYAYDGDLEEVFKASVFDVTFDAIGEQSPCTVLRERDYFEKFRKSAKSSLFDTYVRFYLRIAFHYSRLMHSGLLNEPSLNGLKGGAYWNRWELLHLGGRLVKSEEFKALVREEYAQARSFDQAFTLADERRILSEVREL